MRNLLQLILRFGGFLMFLFLEGICFYLIISFNTSHQQIFLSSSNALVGSVYDRFSATRDYFLLDEQNEKLLVDNQQLLLENERLREHLMELGAFTVDSITLQAEIHIPDSIRGEFHFIGAKVINNSITANNNLLTLDKGKRDGVVAHSGVINGKGIVGVVRNASKNYASVMSILHRQTRVSVAIKDKGYFGTLTWRSTNPRLMSLEAVPKHAVFEQGDTVITSSYSHLFPPGIVVGTIEEFRIPEGGNFYEIDVRLVNDLSRLENGYICIHNDRKELLSIERTENQ